MSAADLVEFKFGPVTVTFAKLYVRLIKEPKNKVLVLTWDEFMSFMDQVYAIDDRSKPQQAEYYMLSESTCMILSEFQGQQYSGLFRVFPGTKNINYNQGFNVHAGILQSKKDELYHKANECKKRFDASK